MYCEDYRKSLPGSSTRILFVDFLNEKMSSFGMSITVAHLRELEKGRRVPSLQLALGIERATSGAVSVREWPGLPPLIRH